MRAVLGDAAEPVGSRRLTLILLGAGIVLWIASWRLQDTEAVKALGFTLGWGRWAVAAAVAAGVAAATRLVKMRPLGPDPATDGTTLRTRLHRVTQPAPRMRVTTAVVVGLVAFAYFVATAHLQGRDLFPKTHDDQSYLLQMQMLARGRLWMPPHPLADFFDTFYVLSRPVYASLYFPGAALLYVPTAWFGLPTWLLPAGVAGAIVGLVYRIVAELVDGTAGLLAALAMVSLEYVRVFSVLLTSHEPMLLFGLLLTWAWLRWRATPPGTWGQARWALMIGVSAGWGAVTRPADALCFALPVGVGMLLDLWRPRGVGGTDPTSAASERPRQSRDRQGATESEDADLPNPARPTPSLPDGRGSDRGHGRGRTWRGIGTTAGWVLLGALPFLALQAVFNVGVTGRLLDTPYGLYLRQDQPNTSFGFHPYDPAARPQSSLPQKRDYYDRFFRPYVLRHQPGTFLAWWGRAYGPMTLDTTLPGRPLAVFLPAGLLALGLDRRRWAVAAAVPLFVGLYLLNTFFLEHYAILIAPAVLLLVLLGMRRVAAAAGPRWSPAVRSGLSAGLAALCVAVLPEFNPLWGADHATGDETFAAPTMRAVHEGLETPGAIRRPAVILFTYRPGDPVVEEPVYNTRSPWPDDADVILAHDLGLRNKEIFRYYAERQPERYFYRWDRQKRDVEELGFARDLGRGP